MIDPRLDRRAFFKLVGAGAAASAIGCSSRPAREIRPYVQQPPELTPGVPRFFASALIEDGFATGVVVETHEGRPTKIEGNPDHPSSRGATRASEQAAVLALYDPRRVGAITDRGLPSTWAEIEHMLARARADRGAGTHLVLEPTTSPIVIDLIERVRAALPAARVTWWSPFAMRESFAGHRIAFGRPLQAHIDLAAADVVVALDADLVGEHPKALAYARQLADRRRVIDARSTMNRIYVVEPAFTATGVFADHRFRARACDVEGIAAALLAELAVLRGTTSWQSVPRAQGEHSQWVAAIARDLAKAGPRSAVIAGERQPAQVHAIVAAINSMLANVVAYSEPVLFEGGAANHELGPLADELVHGAVRSLIVLGGNPAYNAPAQLQLARAMARASDSLYVGLYANETAAACRYIAPALHDLEQWDVARSYDGTLTAIQPMIEPLFGGHASADVLAALLDEPAVPARERAANAWRANARDFEAGLARGCAVANAAPLVEPALDVAAVTAALSQPHATPAFELDVRPHPFVHDGRYASCAWLHELPEPTTKLTWDNAAQLSRATASELGVDTGDLVTLSSSGRELVVPAIVVPGHADRSITLHAGYGTAIAPDIGANAFALWSGGPLAVTVTQIGGKRELARTQGHWSMEQRPIALGSTLARLDASSFASERGGQPSVIASRAGTTGAQWAMSIDLTTCTGCTACVMACAAENNTPVVGREQVSRSREMHWLRIDRYVEEHAGGDADVHVQPMACQHCEDAPCEYVCPVGATTHSPDGLNEMTYNRCVGTRFCSNNCPYKVRRFNWFDFKQHTGLQVLGRNPDVTVRDRGVMEKCTYCVQRIRRAEIDARVAGHELRGNEVRTACQQACPTQAIAFGSLSDPRADVVEQRARPHSYEVLHDQGTRPRTTYLARIRNPNPELA